MARQDSGYQAFRKKLLPTLAEGVVIGVRQGDVQGLAQKWLAEAPGEVGRFLHALAHDYYEENQLHAAFLNRLQDPEEAMAGVIAFLLHVDNWSTCDTLKPRAFARNPQEVAAAVRAWMEDLHTYTRRFGIKMLMNFCLDDYFREEHPALVASLPPGNYYVDMMAAGRSTVPATEPVGASQEHPKSRRKSAFQRRGERNLSQLALRRRLRRRTPRGVLFYHSLWKKATRTLDNDF